jgi:hypothetical protein
MVAGVGITSDLEGEEMNVQIVGFQCDHTGLGEIFGNAAAPD